MIRIQEVSKYYDGFCAVDRISLEIRQGEIVGLLGPNGAGKTSLLRMLTGFFPPSGGTIQVKDHRVDEELLQIKHLIGYLPESAPLYHSMLVYDYLDYVARIRGLDGDRKRTRLRELADLCSLRDIMHKNVSELSKGLKQRVGLAHAMMSEPEILVLDEPTSGLDPNQIVEIRDIIRNIGKAKTVILSTHILSEVEATCDRVVIINRGRIAADDSVAALKQAGGRETQIHLNLLGAGFDAVRDALSGVAGVTSVEPLPAARSDEVAVRVHCRSGDDLRERLYGVVKATDWVLIGLHQESRTLETIFRELTKEN